MKIRIKRFAPNKFTDMFNLIINSYVLREATLNVGLYTWSINQENPTLEKLDRFLMNESWETLFPLTNLRKIMRQLSDHNPLMLCTDQDKIKKKRALVLRILGSNMRIFYQK